MDNTTLRVCLFDRNCEEVPTDVFLILTEEDIQDELAIVEEFIDMAQSNYLLKLIADRLGAYDFSRWELEDVAVLTDCRENLIRFRCTGDTIGEGPNIAMMVNLRLVQ